MAQTILFFIIALVIVVCALLAVTTKYIMRAATYLLFVLLGVAGLYFLMGYTFLGSVQVMVYAGGVVVLFIFALMLTNPEHKEYDKTPIRKKLVALLAAAGAGAVLLFCILSTKICGQVLTAPNEATLSINTIGDRLLSAGKYGYVLPFEAVSVLLLACIVGGLILARKR